MKRYFWIEEHDVMFSLKPDDIGYPVTWEEPEYSIVDSTGEVWFTTMDCELAELVCGALEGMVRIRDVEEYISCSNYYLKSAEELIDSFNAAAFKGQKVLCPEFEEFIGKCKTTRHSLLDLRNSYFEGKEFSISDKDLWEIALLLDKAEFLAEYGEMA